MAVRSSSSIGRRLRAGTSALLALALVACGWLPFGRKSPDDPARPPPGATEFNCAGAKRLYVRFNADTKSAWVIYPDREFRLDRSSSTTGERYSNGISTLTVQGAEAYLDEGSTRSFTDCKRKGAD